MIKLEFRVSPSNFDSKEKFIELTIKKQTGEIIFALLCSKATKLLAATNLKSLSNPQYFFAHRYKN